MAAMQSFGLCSWCLLWILSTSLEGLWAHGRQVGAALQLEGLSAHAARRALTESVFFWPRTNTAHLIAFHLVLCFTGKRESGNGKQELRARQRNKVMKYCKLEARFTDEIGSREHSLKIWMSSSLIWINLWESLQGKISTNNFRRNGFWSLYWYYWYYLSILPATRWSSQGSLLQPVCLQRPL